MKTGNSNDPQLMELLKVLSLAEASLEDDSAPAMDVSTPILRHALMVGAEGLRIVPGPKQSCVEYRLRGGWQEMFILEAAISRHVTTWFKLLTGNVDISKKGIPQEGFIVLTGNPSGTRFLLKTEPVEHGESVSISFERKR